MSTKESTIIAAAAVVVLVIAGKVVLALLLLLRLRPPNVAAHSRLREKRARYPSLFLFPSPS